MDNIEYEACVLFKWFWGDNKVSEAGTSSYRPTLELAQEALEKLKEKYSKHPYELVSSGINKITSKPDTRATQKAKKAAERARNATQRNVEKVSI